MAGAGFAVEVLMLLKNKDAKPALPKQRGQQLAYWPVADYENIENTSRSHDLPVP
jgi:hypothetical protein